MTEQILHEQFPDLSILEFKILGTIAYHGEIPAKYHLRSLAHKSRYREEDVMAAIEKLRELNYLEDDKVVPKHFFRVVDMVHKYVPQWEKTYAWLQTFRYDFSQYLWELGVLISEDNWAAAIALKRPQASLQSKRLANMRMERYLAPILEREECGRLAQILIKDEVDALVLYILESRLKENTLTIEAISEIRQIIMKAGMESNDYDDQLMMFRYLIEGGESTWKSVSAGRYCISSTSPWALATRAISKMYNNDISGAFEHFSEALYELDKTSEVRGTFDNRILSFFYAICLLKAEKSMALADRDIAKIKEKFLKSRNVYYGKPLAATRILLTYAMSEHANCSEYVRNEVKRMLQEDNCPLTQIFADILLGYFKCVSEQTSDIIPTIGILKHELSSFRR